MVTLMISGALTLNECLTGKVLVIVAIIARATMPKASTSRPKVSGKKKHRMVGAWRFELQTSCAQGRRATRLRYAPITEMLAHATRAAQTVLSFE
jgi:hypothetical protein